MDALPKAGRAAAAVVPGAARAAINGQPPAPAKPGWTRTRRGWVIGGVAAVVLAAGLLAWRPWSGGPPRLTDPPPSLAAFVDGPAFAKLPFDRQLTYYSQIDDAEDKLVEAYRGGDLTEDEYRRALQAAYVGRHLGRMQNYFEKPAGRAREAYLDKLLDKKEAEKSGKPVKKKDGKREVPKPDARDAADVKNLKRDDSAEAETIARWPPAVQQQWRQYHAALEERKEQRKELERQQKEAAGTDPATRPATRPAR